MVPWLCTIVVFDFRVGTVALLFNRAHALTYTILYSLTIL